MHVRGYTVDSKKAEEKKIEMSEVQEIYRLMGIEFKEIPAWGKEGLTTVNIFAAVATVCSAVNKVRNDNPDALIGLSGHSLVQNHNALI